MIIMADDSPDMGEMGMREVPFSQVIKNIYIFFFVGGGVNFLLFLLLKYLEKRAGILYQPRNPSIYVSIFEHLSVNYLCF